MAAARKHSLLKMKSSSDVGYAANMLRRVLSSKQSSATWKDAIPEAEVPPKQENEKAQAAILTELGEMVSELKDKFEGFLLDHEPVPLREKTPTNHERKENMESGQFVEIFPECDSDGSEK